MHEENIDSKSSDFVKTPEFLIKKMIVLNPLTKDKTFMDAVILSLYSKTISKNNTRPSNIRKYGDTINWEDINFPPTGADYTMLEKSNVSLNVLEQDEKERFQYIYKSSEFNRKNKIDLILLEIKHVYLKNKFAISISGIFSDSNSDSESKSNQI